MTGPNHPLARILTRRLALIAVMIVALNIAIVGLEYGSDQRALEAYAVSDVIERLAAAIDGRAIAPDAAVRSLFAAHPEAYGFALVEGAGEVLDAMNGAIIPATAFGVPAGEWISIGEGPAGRLVYAGAMVEDGEDGLRIVFAMASDPAGLLRQAFLDEFRQHVWIPILPTALMLILASILVIRRELAPVARAAAWVRGIRPGSVTPPPAGPLPAEVADLVEGVQRALDRLEAALAAESRHAAEAAHALRTPVAVMVARLDALPPSEATDRLRADLAALSRTVQQVLAASRTDVLTAPAEGSIDLRHPAKAVTVALARFAVDRGVELSLSLPDEPMRARANPEGVELALSNLIENAVLHGGPGEVVITVGPGATITVRDHGPGLPPGARARVLEPFWRGAGAAAGGTGLGLAIVDRLQRAQGGTVVVRAPQGSGCEIVLSYEAARPCDP